MPRRRTLLAPPVEGQNQRLPVSSGRVHLGGRTLEGAVDGVDQRNDWHSSTPPMAPIQRQSCEPAAPPTAPLTCPVPACLPACVSGARRGPTWAQCQVLKSINTQSPAWPEKRACGRWSCRPNRPPCRNTPCELRSGRTTTGSRVLFIVGERADHFGRVPCASPGPPCQHTGSHNAPGW